MLITMSFIVVLLLNIFTICSTSNYENNIDRFIVACHTTDFVCFKKQYYYLRSHVLLGSKQLDIPVYQPYKFQYSDTLTCVKITGVEESELVGIRFNGVDKQLSMTITMPVRLQQEDWKNESAPCPRPEKEFYTTGPHIGPLKKFSGNATLDMTFSYTLEKNKSENYMRMEEYNTLDVTLDIPDLGEHNKEDEIESRLYELSEWAYSMVRHVDVPRHTIIPYIDQIKAVYGRLPLERFILLYPSEDYKNLEFEYSDDNILLQH